jgi:hypothetical protein
MLLYACTPVVTVDQVELSGCECVLTDLMVPIPDLIDAATDALTLLTGGTLTGRCTTTVRPCSQGWCYCGMWPCQCCDISGIFLPGFDPVPTEVKIDGAVVPTADYVMVNGRKLARVDGAPWPGNANMLIPDTQVGTFSITYTSGYVWDPLSQRAGVEMVCEMAKNLTGAPTRLPEGTMAATADGVSVQINRLPGQAELDAVGLTWLGRFLSLYGNATTVTEVRSPELQEGWVLNVVETL